MLLTDVHYSQVFTPYVAYHHVFITTDSLINAYSVLFEDSIIRLERTNSSLLKNYLEETWTRLCDLQSHQDKPELVPAVNRDLMVIGVGARLFGITLTGPPDLIKAVDEEAARVTAATGQSKPDWLGPPDSGFMAIDYTRFKPRGFYLGKPDLEAYFRSLSWLQAIPFRFHRDDEMQAFLVLERLGRASDSDKKDDAFDALQDNMAIYRALLGPRDNSDLFSFRDLGMIDTDTLDQFRQEEIFTKSPDQDQINDQISTLEKPERTLRVFSAYRVPDAILFQDTEKVSKSELPSGLLIAALFGSNKAYNLNKSNPELLQKIDAQKSTLAQFPAGLPMTFDFFLQDMPDSSPFNLYTIYLKTLSTLLQPVDNDAPDLFKSPAWQNKSLQTFLGGWAQQRHAWVLQVKENESWLGQSSDPPGGFVEPVPDFYSQLAGLAQVTHDLFGQAGIYAPDIHEAVRQIHALSQAVSRFVEARKHDPKAKPSPEYQKIFEETQPWFEYIISKENIKRSTDPLENLPERLDALADKIEKEGAGSDRYLAQLLSADNPDENWHNFILLCVKLQALSLQQLRGKPFSDADNLFLVNYGKTLAGIMFYGGNSYETPADDAPKICDVYSDPNTRQFLLTGIGQPQQIYVLYPYGGKQYLTQGAVMPYYEFPDGDRLSDGDWVKLLDSPKAPAQPDWLKN